VLIVVGFTISLNSGFFNLGLDGQFLLGATVTTFIALNLDIPTLFVLPLLCLASCLAGAAYALLPAYMKVKLGVNEILTTLMMNFIATYLVSYIVLGPLKYSPTGESWEQNILPITDSIPLSARLPRLFPSPGIRLNAGILIAVLIIFLAYILMEKTTIGYKIKCTGKNPNAAFCAGVNVSKVTCLAVGLSGALCGLAGMVEVTGNTYRLSTQFLTGIGNIAVLVSILGRKHMLGVVATSFLASALTCGAEFLQRSMGIPSYIVNIILSIVILILITLQTYERGK
jgi:simple sugar transport system permease protein